MKRTFLIPALALAACAANAETNRAPANFTGPLVTPNPSNLPQGLVNVEPYLVYVESSARYDEHGTRQRTGQRAEQWQLLLPVTIGLTPRLQAQATLGSTRNISGTASSDGFRGTDTSVNLQYLIQTPADDGRRPAIAVNFSHRFPTGRHDRLEDNPLNGTGTGAQHSTLSVLAQQYIWLHNGRPLRWRARIAYGRAASAVSIDGVSTYGTPGGFRGTARLGRQLSASAAMEYSVSARWVAVMEATYGHTAGGQLRGKVGRYTIDHRMPASSLYTLAPALEYHLNDRFGFIGGVQFSVAGRNSAAFVSPQLAFNMVF